MCRHCESLVEDKQIVHDYMERVATRLSETNNRAITANDLEVTVTLVLPISRYPVLELLKELSEEGGLLL